MSNDSIKKTLQVALAVCFVASILVSSAAVGLKPLQEENQRLDLLKNILIAGDLYKEGEDLNKTFKENISPEIIDLATGDVIPKSEYDDELNLEKFNVQVLQSSSKWGEDIPADKDIAGIKRQPKAMAVYRVMKDDKVVKYILPIFGKGLWSTLYGFIALDKDLNTVKGFTFYQHGETPGLGGEVDNPKWKHLWINKKIYDENGKLRIEVIKGVVDASSPDAKYKVDGLSGATLTTRGVSHLVRFWLGEQGYKPFIDKLKGENKNV
ncbi:Na(+)-translocating NADH-quinone reductase subunit C [hydrothermal vent metagenome]|uniref:Na(+)-translocating NADH-quinone reductase subunit C n=1 Tax=hydrothermal vent metagenome TaxID=652676 RepID=A0A3B1C4S9_9ZZZZ